MQNRNTCGCYGSACNGLVSFVINKLGKTVKKQMLLTVCSVFRINCVIINPHIYTLCGQKWWCGFVNYDDNLV